MSPDERAVRRAELLEMLAADKRHELESSEREVDWLSGYMQTWDQGKAGAVVAMMPFKMSKSMDIMPSMEQQMRTMSGQMGAPAGDRWRAQPDQCQDARHYHDHGLHHGADRTHDA